MKTKKSMLLAMLAVLVIFGILTGCSGGPSDKNASSEGKKDEPAVKKEHVKLTMWTRVNPVIQALFEETAKAFNQSQSDITVELVPYSVDQYNQALQAAIAGNNLPEIMQLGTSLPLTQMEKLNLIQPIPFTQAYMDQFEPGTWLDGRTLLEGKPYVWPDRSFKSSASVMFYNKSLMKQYGLDPENPPASWDELYEQSKKVTEQGKGEHFGLLIGLKQDWFLSQLALQMATSVDGKATQLIGDYDRLIDWQAGTLFQPEPVAEAVNYLKRLKDEKIMNPNALLYSSPDATANFGEGKAAFMLNGQWQLSNLRTKYPDLDIGVAMVPSKSGIPAYYGTIGGSETGFLVSKSADAEAATRWFEFLSEHEYPKMLNSMTDMSPMPGVNQSAGDRLDPVFKQLIDVSDRMFRLAPYPGSRNPAEIEVFTKLKAQTPKEPLGQTLQGYLSGSGIDLNGFLNRFAAEQMSFLEQSVQTVSGASMDDWKFPNWNAGENYTQDKYPKQ